MNKLIKPIVCLAILLIVIALTTGCVGNVDKATGGGWFIDEETGNKCTFGFNVNLKDNPGAEKNEKTLTGKLQFKDHETGVKIHLDEITYIEPEDDYFDDTIALFEGTTKDGYFVYVIVEDLGEPGADAGDGIAIEYYDGTQYWEWYGTLEGGNIQAHPAD
jgi:hypothetical protein